MRIDYDDRDDILSIEFSKLPIVRDVSAGISTSATRQTALPESRFSMPRLAAIGRLKTEGIYRVALIVRERKYHERRESIWKRLHEGSKETPGLYPPVAGRVEGLSWSILDGE